MVVCSVKAAFKLWCVVLKAMFINCGYVVLKAEFKWWCVV